MVISGQASADVTRKAAVSNCCIPLIIKMVMKSLMIIVHVSKVKNFLIVAGFYYVMSMLCAKDDDGV